MATSIDTFIGTLSFFGRLSDELTREVIPPRDYRVRVPGVSVPSLAEAQYKSDGFFCFQDLKVSATGYQLEMTSPLYQPRSFLKTLPTSAPVELTYGGEDEVYVLIKTVNGGGKTVGFDKIPFLTPVPKGTPVIGEGGFATTVRETLEGVDVATASLESVAGLLPGQLLRMVRSRSLLAKPGPYYPFPPGTTRVHVKVVEDAPGQATLGSAQLLLQSVETVAPVGTVVDGVEIKTVTLPGPTPLILGTGRDLETRTDARGQAVFFFPGHWPITTCVVAVTAAGHASKTVTLALTAKQRTLATVKLTPV
ncbi:MAG TPA: hypothetical protein VKI41_13540 [Vicinamibacteria bacterium]|nr:hypothetical protein [Vicinamibacteria bacterium]